MRISTVGYSARQGIKNIFRNKMFSLASVATMSACIFLFGLFFALVMNFTYLVRNVESNVGITVFFEENLDQASINAIGEQIRSRTDLVTECRYVSAPEAWDEFAADYFEGYEEAGEDFRESMVADNPLANSAHYEVYVNAVENQSQMVEYIEGLEGVREVNRSEQASITLSMVNRLISIVSVVIIAILLVVSVFLISNTVAMGISVRKEEIGIMKLIGATNAFVRLPFILEGILIGLVGAVIPLTLLYFLYNQAVQYILARFSILNEFMNGLIPVNNIFRVLLPAGIILGMGIGFVGSMVTIRKHLKV
ncbi:MAG TPA: ABC transporter permease [Candidatus Scatomonas merdigallinarum]|nr:ABC transporter permease [Candidatus Scatomonas merdigallinarum]